MKKPFIAIYTEPRSAGVPPAGSAVVSTAVSALAPGRDAVTAALLVVFANRDAQTLEDVEGTRLNLESQGEGPHVREFDFLREIPDLWDLGSTGDPPVPVGDAPTGTGKATHNDTSDSQLSIANPVGPVPPPGVPPTNTVGPVPSPGVRPTNPAIQPSINPKSVAAIHQCLRLLAGHCDGARTLDGAGFNKMDAEFGHSLASAHALSPKQAVHGQKLIRKYHRQLPADLLQAALGKGTACPPSGGATVSDPARPDANEAPGTAPESPNPSDPSDASDSGVPASSTADPQPECLRTPAQLINHKYTKLVKPGVYEPKSGQEAARNGCEEYYGDTYQNGVKPGPKKLAQFREILELTGTPKLCGQEGKGDEALVHVKLFDPTGSWTWFITEFDPTENTAFGLVNGHEAEVGYIDLHELANVAGRAGIGIEIDMHFTPQTLRACREALAHRAN